MSEDVQAIAPGAGRAATVYRAEGLTKTYGSGAAAVHALRGVDLAVRNEGGANFPDLKAVSKRVDDNPADREQKSDAPGHTFASMLQRARDPFLLLAVDLHGQVDPDGGMPQRFVAHPGRAEIAGTVGDPNMANSSILALASSSGR